MTQIEQIKAELNRRIELYGNPLGVTDVRKQDGRRGMLRALSDMLAFIDSLPAETASPELDSEIFAWQKDHATEDTAQVIAMTARHFAEWQKQQFEKNRLAACDAQTKEEYDRETELIDKIVVGEHRMPTFNDAINYGINWQKKQDDEMLTIAHLDGVAAGREAERKEMMKGAVEGRVCILPSGVAYVEEKDNDALKQYILDNFRAGDKVKLIILKEDD